MSAEKHNVIELEDSTTKGETSEHFPNSRSWLNRFLIRVRKISELHFVNLKELGLNGRNFNFSAIIDLQEELEQKVKLYKIGLLLGLSSQARLEEFAELLTKNQTEWKKFELEEKYGYSELHFNGFNSNKAEILNSQRKRIYSKVYELVFGLPPSDPISAVQKELDRLVAVKRVLQQIRDIDLYLISYRGIHSTTDLKLDTARKELLSQLYASKSSLIRLLNFEKNIEVFDIEQQPLWHEFWLSSSLFRSIDEYDNINTVHEYICLAIEFILRNNPALRTVKLPRQSSYNDVNRFQVGLYRLKLPN